MADHSFEVASRRLVVGYNRSKGSPFDSVSLEKLFNAPPKP